MPERTEPRVAAVCDDSASPSDVALLDALVREHRQAAVAYAARILGDASLAEDAVQRALLQILVRVRGGDEQLLAANARAVVLRGTRWAALKLAERHISRDEAERRAALEPLAGGDDGHDWDRLEARMLVEDILPTLPEHYRDVLRLRYLEGRPDATAAEDLSVTLKAYRRRLDRALAVARLAALRLGVTSLGGVVAALLRRGRQPSVGHVVMAVATLGLIVGTPHPRSGGPAAAARPATGGFALPDDDGGGPAGAPAGSSVAVAAGTLLRHTPQHRPLAGPPSSPAHESLADIDVDAITRAPHAAENHTVVAEGYGTSCACHVFLQTADGGASWAVYPASGSGVILPPDYPRDPRVLLHGGAGLEGDTFCVAASIAASTCTPYPQVPTGSVVLDPDFDAGHPLLYVSTAAGVVSYDLDTGDTQALELNSSSLSGVPIAAAGAAEPWSLYLLVRGSPVAQGMTLAQESPTDALPYLGVEHLVGCRRDGSCATISDVASSAYQLYGDRDDATGRVVVASTGTELELTTDAGLHQRSLAVPITTGVADVQAVGSGASLLISALVIGDRWKEMYLVTWTATGGWSTWSLAGLAPPVSMVYQAVLGDGRVIVGGSAGEGIHCSVDDGAHWARFCPPA